MIATRTRVLLLAGTVVLVILAGARAQSQSLQVGRYDLLELTFTSPTSYANPFADVTFSAQVTEPDGGQLTARGFYDGNGTWKLRFMPRKLGSHSYQTSSNDVQLNGRSGNFSSVSSSRKGPIRLSPSNPHLTVYSDGQAYVPVGDNAFFLLSDDWTQASRLQFVEDMASVSVNKILTCMVNADTTFVFPWAGSATSIDHRRFDLDRMREWDEVLERMRDRGIQAYLWFYSDDSGGLLPAAGSAEEDLYFRYVIARFAAYENVVWNLALEYEEYRSVSWVTSRASFVKSEDPYDHLVAVHQIPDDTFDFHGDTHLDVFSHQGTARSAAAASSVILDNQQSSTSAGRPIAVWLEEEFFDPAPSSRPQVREFIWATTLQGGGYTIMSRNFWGQVGQVRWWNDLGHILARLMERVRAYHEMRVRNDLVAGGGTSKFCMARPGFEYLVLTLDGTAIDLELSGGSGSFDAEWWNPDTGAVSSAGTVQGGQRRSFGVPFAPAVLYVRTSAASDTTPPSVSITNPASNGQAVSGTIALDGTASDASGISRVEYQIGSTTGAWSLATGTTSWSFSLDTTTLPNGAHAIYVRATDGASNTSTPVSRAINVSNTSDTTPPSISITNPAFNGQTVSGALTVSGSASDPSGISRVEYQVDSSAGTWSLAGGTTSWSFSLSTTALANGAHTIYLRATDGAANTSAPVSRTLNVENVNQAPVAQDKSVTTTEAGAVGVQLVYTDPDGPGPYTVTIVTPPAAGTLSGAGNDRTYSPNVGFTGTDRFTWKVSDGSFDSNVATVTVTVIPGLVVTDTSPASYVWDTLDVGKLQYIDRGYTFGDVPSAYVGLPYLRTANGDKGSTGDSFVTFQVTQDVTVYVAYDVRITTRPSWLAGFADSGGDLVAAGATFHFFSRDFPTGTVTLGGNSATGANGNSMYSVVVRPRGGGTAATRVRFVAIDVADIRPSEDLWQYEYRVVGRRFLSDHGFSIFFDPLLYDELEDPPPAVAASWDVQVLQPDAQGSQAGLYDALALTEGPTLDQPFRVRFAWLGQGEPGPQPFEVYDLSTGSLEVLEEGWTVPVPEPMEGLLRICAVGAVALLARARRVLADGRRSARASGGNLATSSS